MHQLKYLEFFNGGDSDFGGQTVKSIYAKLPHNIILNNWSIGVDPGRNFAVASYCTGILYVHYGTIQPAGEMWEYGLAAFNMTKSHFNRDITDGVEWNAVVEGAAYQSAGGKHTGLAYVRFGFFLGLHSQCVNTTLVPPNVARKAVFGSGKIRGGDVWVNINENAADSLCFCLYAAGYRHKDYILE